MSRPSRSIVPSLLVSLCLLLGTHVCLADGRDRDRDHESEREHDREYDRDREHERGHDDDHDRAREALLRGDILPLSAILPDIESQLGARLLSVALEREHGALVYVLELITPGGHILEADVNAATGELLKLERSDD